MFKSRIEIREFAVRQAVELLALVVLKRILSQKLEILKPI